MGVWLMLAGAWYAPPRGKRVREFASSVPARDTPAVLVVQGEAGAGKSTLWRAGIATAEAAGSRVLRSELSAAEADLSFTALADLLTAVLPSVAAGIPSPQREAVEVALLLRPPGDQPPTARAVGAAVLSVLRSCLEAGPLLIAVDDAQWLDPASLDALVFALRRITTGPLSLLLAARSDAPADPLTAGAPPPPLQWRDLLAVLPMADQVTLAPLEAGQIRKLLPGTVTAAQARLVAAESRGNPFWAREIAAHLQSGQVSVPPLARSLTERLASSLSPPAAEALTTVAAGGRLSVSDALSALGYLSDPAAALDAAVLAGVVVETAGRVTAAHPLIAAAAVESLPPGRRVQQYQRLAALSSNPERRAHFAALAAEPCPDPVVADALDAAAEAAHRRAANAAAGQFAAQAVTFTPASDSDALVRRRIRAGELLILAGDLAGSLEHLEALDTSSLGTAELERMLPLMVNLIDVVHGPAAATAMVAGAADTVGADPRRRALVLALASDVGYGIRGGRRAAAVEAIRCAEAAGPVANPSPHRALLNLLIAKATAGEGLDAELLGRAERLEAGLPGTLLYESADLHRGQWSRYTGDLDTARAALQRCIARARDAGDDFALAIFLAYLAATEELAGDYAAAAAALREADDVAAWYDWPSSPWLLLPRCELLIASGDLEGALSLAARLPDDEAQPLTARFVGECVRGKVSSWRDDPAATVRHLERAAHYAELFDYADPGVRLRLDPPLAEAYVTLGRAKEAGRISTWLREIGLRLNRPELSGDAARIDALAAAAAGDLDAAAEHARAAVAEHGRSPLRPELARSLLVLGRIERRRRARGEARAALEQALELATRMAHRPLLAQIGQELPRVAAVRSRSDLTDAERRVADQIVAGATSREAAAALFISVRTVETHVASIYRKLSVRSRSELRRALSAR
jgi:DNA-binding CsgD family transcriptional regulator